MEGRLRRCCQQPSHALGDLPIRGRPSLALNTFSPHQGDSWSTDPSQPTSRPGCRVLEAYDLSLLLSIRLPVRDLGIRPSIPEVMRRQTMARCESVWKITCSSWQGPSVLLKGGNDFWDEGPPPYQTFSKRGVRNTPEETEGLISES